MPMTPEKKPLAAKKEQPFDALNAIAGQPATQMNSLQIVQQSIAKLIPDAKAAQKAMSNIAKAVKLKKISLLQIGNVVFMLKPIGPDAIEFHAFSVEPPEKLATSLMGLYRALKKQGVKHAQTYADRPGYEKIGQQLGLPVKMTQSTRMSGNKMVPVYQFDLEL